MSKVGEIFVVIGSIIVFIALAVVLSFSGIKNGAHSYVKVEVNPKIEFMVDSKEKIITVMPINEEAKVITANESFIGLDIEDGVQRYVELCARANYIDVDREDNSIKLTCIGRLTQALDVRVYKELQKYLINNEIKAIIVDSENDLQDTKSAKKYGVSNDKYQLMLSMCNLYPDMSLEEAKKLSEKKLKDMIKTAHESLLPSTLNATTDEINAKENLMESNSAKYNYHIDNIDYKSISKFKDGYVDYKKTNKKEYEEDFGKQYDFWKDEKDNSGVA